MDHPIIINAFANAKLRTARGQEPTVYIIFKRPSIFYKYTYRILTGTWREVSVAVENAYRAMHAEKQEKHFDRGDQNNLLDTPFDTWCCGECKLFTCDDKTHVKCGSNWITIEHESKIELETYLNNIKHTGNLSYSIEYM